MFDEIRRHLVDEARRLARLVFPEDSPPGGAREHRARPRPRHADVTETALFLEFLDVVARS